MARIVFCFIPAVLGSAVFWLIDPIIALFSFFVGFGAGWIVTRPRPERGEFDA